MPARPDGRSGPHVFVDDLSAPVLGEADRHHLTRVRRLRPGDGLTLGDGRGAWCPARLTEGGVEPVGEIVVVPDAIPPVTVAFPAVKGERTEWAVQKLTELGVDRIVVLVTDRSVVRWPTARIGKALGRLRRVAREAAMQSCQVRIPEVDGPVPFADVALAGACRAELGPGPAPSLDRPTILIGPEGGWSAEERSQELPTVCLGPSVLRVETAALAAAVSLTQQRWLGMEPHGECC